MTFLQLCQRLRQEAGVSGGDSTPSAVTGQVGMFAKIVNWINFAWVDIQTMRKDWNWMWGTATCNTVSGTADYALSDFNITSFDRYDLETMRVYLQSEGQSAEGFLPYLPYAEWMETYGAGTVDDTAPVCFTVLPTPKGTVRLSPAPDDVYVLRVDYHKAASEMSADGDTPEMPSELHNCIWALALLEYAAHDDAFTVIETGLMRARRWVDKLDSRERPQISTEGSPIA